MKMNNKIIVKLVTIAMLIFVIVTFTHCMPENSPQIGNSGEESSNYTPPAVPKDEGQIIKETEVTIGIKNHEQILQTMATLTGVDPYLQTNNTVLNVYNQVSLSLPTGNDVKTFSPSHQIAVSKLAAQFCELLVENQTLRNNIWPGFNFTLPPGSANENHLSSERRVAAINGVLDAFWLGMVEGEELREAQLDLDELLIELSTPVGTETNNATLTRKAMKGLCTATLSSAHVILL